MSDETLYAKTRRVMRENHCDYYEAMRILSRRSHKKQGHNVKPETEPYVLIPTPKSPYNWDAPARPPKQLTLW